MFEIPYCLEWGTSRTSKLREWNLFITPLRCSCSRCAARSDRSWQTVIDGISKNTTRGSTCFRMWCVRTINLRLAVNVDMLGIRLHCTEQISTALYVKSVSDVYREFWRRYSAKCWQSSSSSIESEVVANVSLIAVYANIVHGRNKDITFHSTTLTCCLVGLAVRKFRLWHGRLFSCTSYGSDFIDSTQFQNIDGWEKRHWQHI